MVGICELSERIQPMVKEEKKEENEKAVSGDTAFLFQLEIPSEIVLPHCRVFG